MKQFACTPMAAAVGRSRGRPATSRYPRSLAWLPALLCFTVSPLARAGLGEPLASVARDHEVLRAVAATVTSTPRFEVHELTLADTTRLREYVGPSGTVVGVAWNGPGLPNLKSVLGTAYQEYSTAAAAPHANHHVFSLASKTLVLAIHKLPRGSTGAAYLPALLPAGASGTDFR